jgi:nitroreductase
MAAAQTCSADDVLALIKSRRTAGRIHPERLPPREQIERLLEAFTWVPNHKLTQPWRFFIITGEARKAMGDLYRSIVLADAPDSPELRMRADITAKKPLRAPVTIMVVCQTAAASPQRGLCRMCGRHPEHAAARDEYGPRSEVEYWGTHRRRALQTPLRLAADGGSRRSRLSRLCRWRIAVAAATATHQ